MKRHGYRVLVVADSFYPVVGGAERLIAESGGALLRRGHVVRVVTGAVDRRLAPRERHKGLEIERFPLRTRSTLHLNVSAIVNARRAIHRIVRREGPFEIVHGHHLFAPLGASLCASARRLPRVSTFHGPADQEFVQAHTARRFSPHSPRRAIDPIFVAVYARWLRALQRSIVRSGPCVVLGHFAAGLAAEVAPGLPSGWLRVVPGGVDPDRFRPPADRRAIRKALGLPDTGIVLLTARRLVPGMGVEALIDAVAEVRHRHPGVHLVVAGSGTIDQELAEQAARRGLRSAVTFPGMLRDDALARYYQAADLSILPSTRREPFGLVTLESLACGTPVLATPGGSAEVLRPLGQEFVLADGDASTLASGISVILERWGEDPSLRERCRAYVAEEYSWERAASRLETVYDDVVGRFAR